MSRSPEEIKRKLRRAGCTQSDVARLAKVTWRFVHYVIHGERQSQRVTAIINDLIGSA